MKTDLHLVFSGGICSQAFAFYAMVFRTKVGFTMKYGDAPPAGQPVPDAAKNLTMHTAMPLGGITLMGCDAFPGMTGNPMGGFNVAVSDDDAAEVKRMFAALSEGGSVQMPLNPTFWSPLFGMCTDKFGVEWMVGVPGPEPALG